MPLSRSPGQLARGAAEGYQKAVFAPRLFVVLAMVTGGALVVTTAAIHLHLWAAGYRELPRLGVLFLVQGIGGLVLGPLIVALRRWYVALVGAVYMAASAGGLILSATVGFLGIHDGLGVPWASTALAVELSGFVVLGTAALVAVVRR
jgi:hypothetical protein